MSSSSKIWCLGAVVAANGLLVPSLVYSWLYIYRQYSYPIDFFLPLSQTEMRVRLCLIVAAITVPLTVVLYRGVARDLPRFIRVATLVISCSTAIVAIAFPIWRYLR